MSRPQIVAPVLGADHPRLGGEVLDLVAAGVDRIQWDVTDGHVVPDPTSGADVIGACRPHTQVPFEAHLMVADPDPTLSDFVEAGCETILVHVETCPHLHRTLSRIRELGARAGVAVNPSSSLEFVPYVLEQLDHLLIKTVDPGPGGREYIGAMEAKVSEARGLVRGSGRPIRIEVDGGVSVDTAAAARNSGTELLVAGSALLTRPAGRRAAVEDLQRVLVEASAAP